MEVGASGSPGTDAAKAAEEGIRRAFVIVTVPLLQAARPALEIL